MELTRSISYVILTFILLIASGCGQGTEVLNPQNGEVFVSKNYGFSFVLPEGWTYIEYVDGVTPDETVYQDPLGTADVVVMLLRSKSNFVVLYDTLKDGETFEEYVRARHAANDDYSFGEQDGMEMGIVNETTPGPDGRASAFIYACDGSVTLTLRLYNGEDTYDEAKTIIDEFMSILQTLADV